MSPSGKVMMQPPRGPQSLVVAWRTHTRARGLIAVAAVALLGLALAKDGVHTATMLGQQVSARIAGWHRLERALTQADSGREELPASITATVAALKASGAPAFRLSEGLVLDEFLAQRISEVAWPLPIAPEAPFLVRKSDETSSCALLAQNAGVAIDRCD